MPGQRDPLHSATYVVPCFNESTRLDRDLIAELKASGCRLVLVDDGSTDDTAKVLAGLADEQTQVLTLDRNVGKAEAVRRGLLRAIEAGAPVVGFADADFATPPRELARLVTCLEERPDLDVVLGSRVQLAGRSIVRRSSRHYVGRVIATWLSMRSGLVVYDTQCGAKLFRCTPALRSALAEPFGTRWLFDVELLVRLEAVDPTVMTRVREVPLEIWTDVAGSRLFGRELGRVLRDFVRLEFSLARTRRRKS